MVRDNVQSVNGQIIYKNGTLTYSFQQPVPEAKPQPLQWLAPNFQDLINDWLSYQLEKAKNTPLKNR